MAISSPTRMCSDCGGPMSGKLTAIRCRACYDAGRPLKVTLPPGFATCSGCGLRVRLPLTECPVCEAENSPSRGLDDWREVMGADRSEALAGLASRRRGRS